MKRRTAPLLLALCLGMGLFACKKNTEDATPDTNSKEHVAGNQWIYEQMASYYFWTDKLPSEANTDQTLEPESYFTSLLNTYNATSNPDGDRFSYFSPDAATLEAALNGESLTTGMQFRLFYRDNARVNIVGQVLYVLKGSPAAAAGFKRGDVFTKVNGTTLTTTNYESLLYGSTTSYSFTLGTVSTSNTIEDTSTTLAVTATTFQEDPVFLDSTYTVNGKKVGYLVYNQFVSSPNNSSSNAYDNHLRQIFGDFKSAGVQELILDLRYNPGGSGATATTLASLIVKYSGATQIFYKEEYNSQMNQYLQQQYGSDAFNAYFTNESNNVGNQISKVTILTSEWTASASELVINGLKPYMTVNLIGETTYGKNVGSTTLTDDTGKYSFALQPIIVKVYNSLGASDYTAGFTPNTSLSEPFNLYALGNTQETLLNAALYGTSTGGRQAAGVASLSSSITKKATFGKLLIRDKDTAVKSFMKKRTSVL
ncbi:S41 family peptidase [Siphonobacter sp. SORGH_AS_1065]|uniref:S41 family peptidase n=1 Tax=Siphonobacter sp. SORGH_AS_1065 TaxID=3041795 RepID=UPI002781E462|nr:S41 family peptidase [Siphonobacter sp. SORGH_AS_1065]MDQ1088332.1 carboxyl-terminal processing protease [Siphonobacter sp. SORGH_AS_1065]